jgi:hypothetical protein
MGYKATNVGGMVKWKYVAESGSGLFQNWHSLFIYRRFFLNCVIRMLTASNWGMSTDNNNAVLRRLTRYSLWSRSCVPIMRPAGLEARLHKGLALHCLLRPGSSCWRPSSVWPVALCTMVWATTTQKTSSYSLPWEPQILQVFVFLENSWRLEGIQDLALLWYYIQHLGNYNR